MKIPDTSISFNTQGDKEHHSMSKNSW